MQLSDVASRASTIRKLRNFDKSTNVITFAKNGTPLLNGENIKGLKENIESDTLLFDEQEFVDTVESNPSDEDYVDMLPEKGSKSTIRNMKGRKRAIQKKSLKMTQPLVSKRSVVIQTKDRFQFKQFNYHFDCKRF